jgi:hypothetical protein
MGRLGDGSRLVEEWRLRICEALGAFVEIAKNVGDRDLAERYEKLVLPMPARWEEMVRDGDHYKLAFDQSGTFVGQHSESASIPSKDHADRHSIPNRCNRMGFP